LAIKNLKLLWEGDLLSFDKYTNIIQKIKPNQVKLFWTKTYPGSLIIVTLNENKEIVKFRLDPTVETPVLDKIKQHTIFKNKLLDNNEKLDKYFNFVNEQIFIINNNDVVTTPPMQVL
jgi:hypothetical protein